MKVVSTSPNGCAFKRIFLRCGALKYATRQLRQKRACTDNKPDRDDKERPHRSVGGYCSADGRWEMLAFSSIYEGRSLLFDLANNSHREESQVLREAERTMADYCYVVCASRSFAPRVTGRGSFGVGY